MFQKAGKLYRKPKEMAEMQLQYYTEKIRKLQRSIPTSNRNPHRLLDRALGTWEEKDGHEIFEFREISLLETFQLISTMSESNALGHDNIDAAAVKTAAQYLANPLRKLINLSLTQGKFLQKWKFAKVTPRLKSRGMCPTDTSSYRPVAVVTTTSKLIERAAQVQLLNFMETSGQLNPSAHAYRKDHSTITTLMEIIDEIHKGADEKKCASLMAIDSVNHSLLFQKMERCNVGSGAIMWVRNYLNFRTQYVTIGRGQSSMDHVRTGVPQGSVIGPLFFAIFTNEMSLAVKRPSCDGQSHLDRRTLFGDQCSDCGILTTYADDSTYTVTSRTRQTNQIHLIRSLDKLECFLNDNKLVINLSKTSVTECLVQQKKGRNPGTPPSLLVTGDTGEDEEVPDKGCTRILGANLQANMGWYKHLETGEKAILPQARKQLGMLKSKGKLIPMSSRLNLARGLVLSKLAYIMPLWGGGAPAHIRRAQVLMNATARWATGMPRKTKIPDLMDKTGWLTIVEQIKLSTLVQAWKLVHHRLPHRILNRMNITQDLKIEVDNPRLQITAAGIRIRAAREWNQVPDELRYTLSIGSFKRQAKKMILLQRNREPD